MKCSVCKKDFILCRDQADYETKKKKLENELSNYVEENLEKDEEGCWIKVMNEEALLLRPNHNPRFCPAEVCGAILCNYCYGLTKKYYDENLKCPICHYKYTSKN
jgi:hypothetical protein